MRSQSGKLQSPPLGASIATWQSLAFKGIRAAPFTALPITRARAAGCPVNTQPQRDASEETRPSDVSSQGPQPPGAARGRETKAPRACGPRGSRSPPGGSVRSRRSGGASVPRQAPQGPQPLLLTPPLPLLSRDRFGCASATALPAPHRPPFRGDRAAPSRGAGHPRSSHGEPRSWSSAEIQRLPGPPGLGQRPGPGRMPALPTPSGLGRSVERQRPPGPGQRLCHPGA